MKETPRARLNSMLNALAKYRPASTAVAGSAMCRNRLLSIPPAIARRRRHFRDSQFGRLLESSAAHSWRDDRARARLSLIDAIRLFVTASTRGPAAAPYAYPIEERAHSRWTTMRTAITVVAAIAGAPLQAFAHGPSSSFGTHAAGGMTTGTVSRGPARLGPAPLTRR